MLSVDSYVPVRKGLSGLSLRRRWIKMRLHTRRLASIGANAVELRGLFGHLARLVSWLGWFGLLLWNLLLRFLGKLLGIVFDAVEDLVEWNRKHSTLRQNFHEAITHLKSLTQRRQRGERLL